MGDILESPILPQSIFHSGAFGARQSSSSHVPSFLIAAPFSQLPLFLLILSS
jgi:hypothetical protein